MNILLTSTDSQGDRVMSLHRVACVDFPGQVPTATAPYFLNSLNSTGSWVIRKTAGELGSSVLGMPPSHVRDESADGNFMTMHCPEGLELESSQFSRLA
jgi:hypothetical protein